MAIGVEVLRCKKQGIYRNILLERRSHYKCSDELPGLTTTLLVFTHDDVFPIIAKTIETLYVQSTDYVTRDKIVTALLNNPKPNPFSLVFPRLIRGRLHGGHTTWWLGLARSSQTVGRIGKVDSSARNSTGNGPTRFREFKLANGLQQSTSRKHRHFGAQTRPFPDDPPWVRG